MAKRDNPNRGVFVRKGKAGESYGIDYVHPLTGQRVRKIVKDATSLEEAVTAREIELTDARRGAMKKAYGIRERPKAVPFGAMVDKYLAWSKDHKKSWKTDADRAGKLKRAFRGKLLTDITPALLEAFMALRAKRVKKETVNRDLSLGCQVFEKAIEWGMWTGPNPFRQVAWYKVRKGKKPGSLTPEDVRAIRDAIDHPVKRAMVTFAFHTGWRISEIRTLKWEDVNLLKGSAWILEPKNGESVEVPLSAEALRAVRAQRRRGPYVFCKLNGDPWRTNMQRGLKEAARRAGVALPLRKAWHIFRRTWASMMLQGGCDVETLRVLGNWKTPAMPLWYADAAGVDRQKELLERVPELKAAGGDGTEKAQMKKVVNLSDWKKG